METFSLLITFIVSKSITVLAFHTHTYIYIYIYSHPQTDRFDVSKLFCMVRHVGRLKLESKPAQLYVRFCIMPLSQQANHICAGRIRHYAVAFVCFRFHTLPDTRLLNSFEELFIMRVTPLNSFARLLTTHGGAYIHIYIYIYICVCVCVCERERERGRERESVCVCVVNCGVKADFLSLKISQQSSGSTYTLVVEFEY